MGDGHFGRFFAWAATSALLVVGLSLFVFGVPFLICGIFGLVYLARRPPRWPGLLGAPAGLGVVMMLWGLAASLTPGYETEGVGLIGGGAVLAIAVLLLFRRAAAKARIAGDRRSGPLTDRGDGPSRPASMMLRRFPVWFALALFLVPSGLLWVYGNEGQFSSQGEFACLETFRGAGEGADITREPSLWPPGGKCAYHGADGAVTVRSKEPPWPEWIVLAVLSSLAGVCSWGYVTLLRSAEPA